MQNLLNPRWTLLTSFLPTAILIVLFIGHFSIIHSLMSPTNIWMLGFLGGGLLLLSGTHLAYVLQVIFKKESLNFEYGVAIIIAYTIYLRLYFFFLEDIFPMNVPRWMLSEEAFLQVVGFLMPTIIHALFIAVVSKTNLEKQPKAWHHFVGAIAIPIMAYVFFQVFFPMLGVLGSDFEWHVVIIFLVVGTIFFLFLLTRGIYIMALKQKDFWQRYRLVWQIPISLIFPIAGLLLNNQKEIFFSSPPFGDFDHFWFYFIAVANSILLLIPSPTHFTKRLFLFLARSVTFAYTTYFFLVFIPFLPLSVLAILAAGFGFLLLSPLLLFVFHGQTLWKDYLFLKENFSDKTIVLSALGGFLTIPLFIVLTFVNTRININNALEYVYAPDYEKEYHFNESLIAYTLKSIKNHKSDNRGFDIIAYQQTPYISSLFNWIVLDRLTLSDSKINKLSQVFLGEPPVNSSTIRRRDTRIFISDIATQTTYHEEDDYWTTWVDFDITNATGTSRQEFATTFELPEGCWISDYYLMIGDRKEKGILAEKKAASWIYNQIVSVNRDPGILRYETGNDVSFRIFPFQKDEIRKTGIQFIHKSPVEMQFDDYALWLGDSTFVKSPSTPIQLENTLYISAKAKEKLPKIQRQAYTHFIVDVSKGNEKNVNLFIKKIQNYLKKDTNNQDKAKISFTNTYVNTIDIQDNWEEQLRQQKFEGGFFLEMALKKNFYKAFQEAPKYYPNFVVISDQYLPNIIKKDFEDFAIAFPEAPFIQQLNLSGQTKTYSLKDHFHSIDTVESYFNQTVVVWPNAEQPLLYLPDNNQASTIFLSSKEAEDSSKLNKWEKGLHMQGQWQAQTFFPKRGNQQWLQLVKSSFTTGIMNPTTAYIALENEAQKAMLQKKQQQVLQANKFIDIGEETRSMSEPEWYLILVLFCLFMGWQRRKHLSLNHF